MATTSRPEDLALARFGLEKRLFDEPYCFEFFQAVRLLRRFYPNREGVGQKKSPADEIVRFGVHSALTFPPSELYSLEERPGEPPLMRVNFMGLTGAAGSASPLLHRVGN